jgi:hypothetical protein
MMCLCHWAGKIANVDLGKGIVQWGEAGRVEG